MSLISQTKWKQRFLNALKKTKPEFFNFGQTPEDIENYKKGKANFLENNKV